MDLFTLVMLVIALFLGLSLSDARPLDKVVGAKPRFLTAAQRTDIAVPLVHYQLDESSHYTKLAQKLLWVSSPPTLVDYKEADMVANEERSDGKGVIEWKQTAERKALQDQQRERMENHKEAEDEDHYEHSKDRGDL